MSKRKVIVADRAVQSFKRLVANLQKTSLIGGEDARVAIIQAIRKIGINPMASSENAEFAQLDGEYRFMKVWDVLIYYKVSDQEVLILDLIREKK